MGFSRIEQNEYRNRAKEEERAFVMYEFDFRHLDLGFRKESVGVMSVEKAKRILELLEEKEV